MRPGSEGPAYDRTAPQAPVLHLRGPILLGPEEEVPEAWVVGGRIRHQRPDLPSGTEVREVDGYVLPGLADLHCHVGISDEGTGTTLDQARGQARTDRDTGVLLIRDAGSIIDTAPLQRESDLPRIIRAGRHVARTRRYLIGYAHEVDPDQLPATVATEAQRGDGWVKLVGDWIDREAGDLTPTWSAEDFRVAAEVAHAGGARITTHTFDEETLPLVLDAGFDCLEHATGLTDATIARAAEAGVPVVTTLVNVDEFETYASQGEKKFPRYADHMRRLRAQRFERTRDAHDAGIQLLTGTDAGGVLGHGIIHDELDELAACGLDPVAILQAASWAPREFLGVPGLEDGAPADLLVVDEDPRRDHRTLRAPSRIVLDGAVVR
ncbi:amidohydrolase [Brachybacterium endophyticum]|uniref:Amidohydrolase n=1 Tax=Brachybacterium endophyticum TaxID=2182385 RepID=A0A2U2RMM6_9MICO|nr:amidohydrolase family protein [Brachybacterium endophyticum]PWH07045.1 amidohydrolase [Brachybacterium endophyticum]